MDSELTDKELQEKLDQRFKELPKVLQDAIHSADIQAHMRGLADQHKLHFDQWQQLENNVMLALFGFQDPEDLSDSFRDDLGVDQTTADALASDVLENIFQPIRDELEKNLEYAVESFDEEDDAPPSAPLDTPVPSPQQAVPPPTAPVASAPPTMQPIAPVMSQPAPTIAPLVPGTPPAPPPEKKAVRAPISESYSAGQASHERKIVEGDPYRESAT